MKQLFKSIYKENRWIFYLTLFVAIISAWADISSWVVQKYILDNLVNLSNFKTIWLLLMILFITYCTNQIFWALTYYFSAKFWEKLETDYKKRALEKFNKIKYSILLDKKEWEINSIISKWTVSLSRVVDSFFAQIIQNWMMVIFWLSVLFIIDKNIFFYFVFVFIPIFVFYSIKQIKKRVPILKDVNNKDNKVSGEVVEYFSNIRDIKIFWVENNFTTNFLKKFLDIFSLNLGLYKKQHYMNFVQFIILIWSMCLILAYTWYNILQWVLTIWTFILVYHIFWTIRFALWDLVFLYNRFEEDLVKVRKFLDFFEIDESNQKIEKLNWSFNKLEIKDLSFSYDNKTLILKNIKFELKTWEKIAIVWKSWQWKTTFISLILWLFDWYSWNILFNDRVIYWKLENIFSYVPQDTNMFNETIKFNLTLWEYYQDNILLDILSKVWLDYLSSRVEWNKNLLDIQVGSGWLKLSWWEKQRLGIARAMIREKDIFIFDEITSNLDEETEKDILDLIFNIAKDKTFIVITHKKEVLKKVDRIYEMKEWRLNKLF